MNFNLPRSLAPLIIDIRAQLPQRPYNEKMGKVLGTTVHHGAGDAGAYGIAEYHVNHPKNPQKPDYWAHIGYNFVIEMDGKVYYTLDLDSARPYHAGYTEAERRPGDNLALFPDQDPRYYNDHYWAVCLQGNASKKAPTKAQLASLFRLLAALKSVMGTDHWIGGHRELPGKASECPGTLLDCDYIRVEVEKLLKPRDDLGQIAYPQEGDDPWLKAFPTTRDAAIAMKGAADNFGRVLVQTRDSLQTLRETPLWKTDEKIKMLIAEIKKVTG